MTNWEEGSVHANGISLHYYRTGGSKPPLVLAHGMTDNGLCWTRVARVLEHDYDVIMYDARGHGHSDAPAGGYDTETRADDLAGLIKALNLHQPAVIGHSMGADTAAMAAARHPELIRAVVLEDPPWRAVPSEQSAASYEAWREQVIERKRLSKAELIAIGRAQSPTWDAIEFEAWAEAKQQVSPDIFTWLAGPRTPWQEVVPRIICPALLITADPQRAIVTPEVAQTFLQLVPQGHSVPIDGAGHNIRREQFERYMEAVTSFLRDIA